MVGSGSSKILTVSYGTFSCTLEGFDDPFSTMRGIAEYFRDLAADDRYFGAEPPTPDAEMLHRIAEREIQRRVESRVQGDGIVLRQLDTGLVEDEDDAPAAEIIEADTPAPKTREASAAPAAPEPAPEPEAEPEAEVEPVEVEVAKDNTIEEKLSRIRAVVERSRSRDLGAAAVVAAEAEDADDEAMEADMSPGFAGDIDATLISQVIAEQDDGYDRVAPGEDTADAAPAWDFSEDATAEEETSEPDEEPEVEDSVEEIEVSLDAHGADETHVPETADRGDDAAGQADMVDEDEDEEDADAVTGAAIAKILAADAEDGDTKASDMPTPAFEEGLDETPEITLEMDGGADSPDASRDADETDDLWAEKDTQATEAFDEFDADEIEDAAEADDMPGADEDGRTLDIDADDLSDWKSDAEKDGLPAEAPSLAETRAERTLSKSSQLRAPDEESERLESQTETAFAENEGSRRRSAIAHLRAAVAATRADRILSRVVGRDAASDPEEQKSYREDLSKVVKPRQESRPLPPSEMEAAEPEAAETEVTEHFVEPQDDVVEVTETERVTSRTTRVKTRMLGPEDTVSAEDFLDETEVVEEEGATPLMLVSELRVSEDAGAAMSPRRAAEEESHASDDEFAAFAEKMGAEGLPDLIEAAAAYSAYVEGNPHFSRPQVMRRVGRVDPIVEESREAALRAFGQLLRQGRIQKLERGQFRVSDATRFNPEHRIAGE